MDEVWEAQFEEAARATKILRLLACGAADRWDSHDNTIRIAFALNNISRGSDLLLGPFTQLVRSSPKAEANVAEWAASLYRTLPPAAGARPGITFLRSLLGPDVQAERAELKEALALAGCPTDDRFIDGVEKGYVLLLGEFLAVHSLRDYRVALDVVQHDKPGNRFGHVLYSNDGARWVHEASAKKNYLSSLSRYLFSVLELVIADNNLKQNHCDFWGSAKSLHSSILKDLPFGKRPFEIARDMLRDDQFFRDNGVPVPEEFFKLLNSQHHLMGFNNGVLNMKEFKFYSAGHAQQDYYVSYSTGYDFPGGEDGEPITDAQRAEMDEVEELLKTFFPRNDIRQFFQSVMTMAAGAATLKQIQLFCIFWGHLGSNGKSALLNWLGMVFGPCYIKSLDPGYLVCTADPNKPQSGLMEMRGVRLARINEAKPPETGSARGGGGAPHEMAIQNEFLKRWTGGDPIQMRGMYGNSVQVTLDAIPILVVNSYPRFSEPDEDAKVRREGLVPFESRFVDSAALANPEAYVFAKDVSIEKTFERLVPAFALCLVKWGRLLAAANFKLQRPFATYPQIRDYIDEIANDGVEPDSVLFAQQQVARLWLNKTFVAADLKADCPATGSSLTCPEEFQSGKKAGQKACPCVWKSERLFELFQAAHSHLRGDDTVTKTVFDNVLRKTFQAKDYMKDRHATGRSLYIIKVVTA